MEHAQEDGVGEEVLALRGNLSVLQPLEVRNHIH
jgi:hypothetical protein